jgi:hypothetical protein
MSTVRDYWTAAPAQPIRVRTPRGSGTIITAIPLDVQVARNAIGVAIDGCTTGAKYFAVDEIRCERREDEMILLEAIANVSERVTLFKTRTNVE